MSEVSYEVHMTRVLHTARISNVDSLMFVDGNKRDGEFLSSVKKGGGGRVRLSTEHCQSFFINATSRLVTNT